VTEAIRLPAFSAYGGVHYRFEVRCAKVEPGFSEIDCVAREVRLTATRWTFTRLRKNPSSLAAWLSQGDARDIEIVAPEGVLRLRGAIPRRRRLSLRFGIWETLVRLFKGLDPIILETLTVDVESTEVVSTAS
jgi:hypothetical protein